MSRHLNAPVTINASIDDVEYAKFAIYPQVIMRDGDIDIVGWRCKFGKHPEDLYSVLAQTALGRRLTNRVCVLTFEKPNRPSVPVKFDLDGETWSFNMRAVEREDEMVFFEIEIADEWVDLIDTYVGDIVPEEYHPFAENVARGSVSFGDRDAIYAMMA